MKAKVKTCEKCGAIIASQTMYCPHCGSIVSRAAPRDSAVTRPSIVILFLMLGIPSAFAGLASLVVIASPSIRLSHTATWVGFAVLGVLGLLIFGMLSWELFRELRRRL